MEKFRYEVVFKSPGVLTGEWSGTIEEFRNRVLNPNLQDIHSYQIWSEPENSQTTVEDDLFYMKRDADLFDQMIEQHEQEELEKDVAEQWAKEQYLRDHYRE